MQIVDTEIAGLKIISPKRFSDDRGWFEEVYRRDLLVAAGIDDEFVQANVSFSSEKGVVRGLHFQIPPFAQAKLLRVLVGSVMDVVVDIRRGSTGFGRHVAIRLDADKGQIVYIPPGFAHGFCTLVPNTLIWYYVSAYYSGAHDRSLLWNDPALRIAWPVSPSEAILSPKDRAAPPLSEIGDHF
jgi:dTDP-4-dehydrorhamnose 3,5-epimerase